MNFKMFKLLSILCVLFVTSVSSVEFCDVYKDFEYLECRSAKGVHIVEFLTNEFKIFCIFYEKTRNSTGFDILQFKFSAGYNLTTIGAINVGETGFTRKYKVYSGDLSKFQIVSNASNDLGLISIAVNEIDQKCWRVSKQTIETCGKKDDNPSLAVYGYSATPGDDPWIAHVFLTDGTESFYKCASTIISKRAVLTSMSCVMMEGRLMNPSEFEIQVARFVISRPSLYTRTYEVRNIIGHKKFDVRTLIHNLAIVKVKNNIEFNKFIQPICLPRYDQSFVNQTGSISGFGNTHVGVLSDVLLESSYPVHELNNCGKNCSQDYINKYSFSAGLKTLTNGNVCSADLGSGLYFEENNRWVVGGLVSKRVLRPFDVSCNRKLLETVIFTSIAEHINWIEQNYPDQMSYSGDMV